MKTLLVSLAIFFSTTHLFTQNQSLKFDSLGQYVEIGDPSELRFEIGTSFTIECWVKVDTTATTSLGTGTLVSKMGMGSARRGYELAVEDGDPVFVMANRYGSNYFRVEPLAVDLNDGQWHHIGAAYRAGLGGQQVKFYVDGVGKATIVSCGSCLTDTITNDLPVLIGSRSGGNGFQGWIDEVRIWGQTRFNTQTMEAYDTELDGTEVNLLAYFKFDDDSTDCVFDCTTSQFHGQRFSAPNGISLPSFSTDVPPITDVACVNTPTTDCFINASIEPLALTGIQLYPNPSTGWLTIDIPNGKRIEALSCFDAQGRKVHIDHHEDSSNIDLRSLTNGLYFVVITIEGRSFSDSFLLQR